VRSPTVIGLASVALGVVVMAAVAHAFAPSERAAALAIGYASAYTAAAAALFWRVRARAAARLGAVA
jgi:uncharacterized membrane protein YqjE